MWGYCCVACRDDRQPVAVAHPQLGQHLLLGRLHHRRHQLLHAHLPQRHRAARRPLLLRSGEHLY